MHIRILALFVLAFAFSVAPILAACPGGALCFTFDPNTTSHTFDFGNDGAITFQFETVLTPGFDLDVTAVEDALFTFSGPDFPGTTTGIFYNNGHTVRYNVTGANGGPVPVKGVNFRGLITVLLNYDSSPIFDGIPAFGHAPGDTTTAPFSEDILTFYVDPNACATTFGCDPGMGGKVPNISSFEAFKKPFANGGSGAVVCSPGVTAVPQTTNNDNNPIVEVSFKLASSNANCANGPFLRDKTATLSVGLEDPATGKVTPQPLVNGGDSNKFHFNNQNGVNVQDINTNGIASGTQLNITVISTVFAPVNIQFTTP
jgi:hypothetical protein